MRNGSTARKLSAVILSAMLAAGGVPAQAFAATGAKNGLQQQEVTAQCLSAEDEGFAALGAFAVDDAPAQAVELVEDDASAQASASVGEDAPAQAPATDAPAQATEATPEIRLAESTLEFTGGVRKPSIKVYVGEQAISSSYYTVTYDNPEAKDPGTYGLTVTFNSGYQYSGSARATYQIVKRSIKPELTLDWTSTRFNGRVQRPRVTVRDAEADRNISTAYYDITWTNQQSTDAGSYKVTVKLKGGYSGSASATYKITKSSITPKVELAWTSIEFNGRAQKPRVSAVYDGDLRISTAYYDVSYANESSTQAGTYKVTVKLKGGYAGSKTLSYTITPTQAVPRIALGWTSSKFNGATQKPSVQVFSGEKRLGKDYFDLTYSNINSKAVGTYTVTAKLKGGYSGTVSATYKIVTNKITPTVKLTWQSKAFTGGVQKPGVQVYNGEKRIGSDYFTVAYDNASSSKVGTYGLTVTLKGGYSGSASASYKITRANNGASVELSWQTATFTGGIKRPGVMVYSGDRRLGKDYYTATYSNPESKDPGTYTVTVTLKNGFTGTATATYTIVKQEVSPRVELSWNSIPYTGRKQIPSVKVYDGATGKAIASKYFDQSVSDPASTALGTYTLTVTLKNGYEGTGSATYSITTREIKPRIVLSWTKASFDGTVKRPTVTPYYGNDPISAADYSVIYDEEDSYDTGIYSVTVKCRGGFTGSSSTLYEIVESKINPRVVLSWTSKKANGTAQRPSVLVYNGNKRLSNEYYGVTYDNLYSTKAGTYGVTVHLMNGFAGSVDVYYRLT